MSGENRFAVLPKVVIGLAMVAFGAILLADNFGMLEADVVLRWFWPVALYALGGAMLMRGARCGGFFWGAFWIVVATLLLLHRIGYRFDFRFDFWGLLWPTVLLLFGLHLVRRALSGPRPAASAGGEGGALLNHFAVLAGNDLRSASPQFRGGDLAAFMGACKVDLSKAQAVPEGALIDTFAVWGAVEIRVPEGWRVISEVTPVLAGFEDKTRPPVGEPTGKLTVRGFAIMGAVEVTN